MHGCIIVTTCQCSEIENLQNAKMWSRWKTYHTQYLIRIYTQQRYLVKCASL
jgi:hypothetical protein